MVDIVRRLAGAWSDSVGRLDLRRRRPIGHPAHARPRVLVVGVYLGEKENLIEELVPLLSSSRNCEVTQRWISIGRASEAPAVAAVTVGSVFERTPKFALINRLVAPAEIAAYDYIMVCDDDVSVPPDFTDRFIGWQQHCGFSLAQPARTWNSHLDHAFVRRRLFCKARQTRFVEIGPIFCLDRQMARLLLPFDQTSPMGWGYDLIWPVVAHQHGLTLGIVDDAAVEHRIRPRGALYATAPEIQSMQALLAAQEHLAARDAFVVCKRYR